MAVGKPTAFHFTHVTTLWTLVVANWCHWKEIGGATVSESRRCFICGEDRDFVLEEHHQIPKRLGGSNSSENLYTLCSNCHRSVEAMFDDYFFERLGVTDTVISTIEESEPPPDIGEVIRCFVDEWCLQGRQSFITYHQLMRAFYEFCEANGCEYEGSRELVVNVLVAYISDAKQHNDPADYDSFPSGIKGIELKNPLLDPHSKICSPHHW